MRSIIVVSLSPAIDRNYIVPSFTPGCMHRCENPVISPGGKGINVARILSLLGAKAHTLGFFAGENGQYIVRNLHNHGVVVDPTWLKGETRSSLNILDPANCIETEILEAGPFVYPDDMNSFLDRFRSVLAGDNNMPIVIFSGGKPRGLEADIYQKLIEIAKSYNALCILDSSADALTYGVASKPYMIKPNRRELAAITNNKIDSECEITKEYLGEIYKQTRALEIPLIAVTLGSKGAVLCAEGKILYAHPIETKTINTIGSGDSFTAGMAYAIANNYSWRKALELAVACATSNATFEQVGFIDISQVETFNKMVHIELIE